MYYKDDIFMLNQPPRRDQWVCEKRRSNSIANALELSLCLSCTNPSRWLMAKVSLRTITYKSDSDWPQFMLMPITQNSFSLLFDLFMNIYEALTHWSRNKMVAVKESFSITFSWKFDIFIWILLNFVLIKGTIDYK